MYYNYRHGQLSSRILERFFIALEQMELVYCGVSCIMSAEGKQESKGDGVLIFDEVKVISRLMWNSRSDGSQRYVISDQCS